MAGRLGAQLEVIAEQVKSLPGAGTADPGTGAFRPAFCHARCAFRRIPGKIYRNYEHADGDLAFDALPTTGWPAAAPSLARIVESLT